jgi:3-deoxy-manno-octulosonate cytidylyltransferase (CMP-KDO synthetase)
VLEQARKVPGVARVIVATDDERILKAVEQHGGRAVMTSADCQNGSERVAEAALNLQADIIVNLQGDEPLIDPDTVAAVIQPVKNGVAPMATAMTKLKPEDQDNPDVVKVWTDEQGLALGFSRQMPEGRPAMRHVGLYVFRKDLLLHLVAMSPTPSESKERLEQLRALENQVKIAVVRVAEAGIGVDTPEQLERVRRIHEERA